MSTLTTYLQVFLVGGILCTLAQILIDKTKWTPARIVVLYVCAGVFLTAIGVYDYVVEFGKAGATVPLTGFGYSLAKGVERAVSSYGLLGAFLGGLQATAGGIAAAIVFGIFFSLFSKPRDK
ncbi:MAG: stage V sporulation protein AE [Clostridia bacterium]|nr:stage V sporulation protein AE [Clostridia bacterium]